MAPPLNSLSSTPAPPLDFGKGKKFISTMKKANKAPVTPDTCPLAFKFSMVKGRCKILPRTLQQLQEESDLRSLRLTAQTYATFNQKLQNPTFEHPNPIVTGAAAYLLKKNPPSGKHDKRVAATTASKFVQALGNKIPSILTDKEVCRASLLAVAAKPQTKVGMDIFRFLSTRSLQVKRETEGGEKEALAGHDDPNFHPHQAFYDLISVACTYAGISGLQEKMSYLNDFFQTHPKNGENYEKALQHPRFENLLPVLCGMYQAVHSGLHMTLHQLASKAGGPSSPANWKVKPESKKIDFIGTKSGVTIYNEVTFTVADQFQVTSRCVFKYDKETQAMELPHVEFELHPHEEKDDRFDQLVHALWPFRPPLDLTQLGQKSKSETEIMRTRERRNVLERWQGEKGFFGKSAPNLTSL